MAELEAMAARGAHAEALERLRSRGAAATTIERRWEGILLLHLGREDEAVALFRQCVFLEPEDPVHRRWLAVGLAAVGRDEDAERETRNALALER
jgi:Flp pilus assembly protein TadD